MIIRIHSAGKSFKGLGAYLTHDPNAETADRVGWTHTLNLAHDHIPSAIDEMLWTARSAELLKQQAGIRAGGRATENVNKHVSLNWSPEEAPTREHMIETAQDFLRHMGWQEHQAILVEHEDKAFAHVHLMINAVHLESGLHLDDNFEFRRAQAWGRHYEEENGHVYCEQRLANSDEREDAPTRPAWMAFQNKQKEFERDENALSGQGPILMKEPENPKLGNSSEWKKLKELQREERMSFFAEGKMEFSELRRSVYREVREEFRERWGNYYSALEGGADQATLASLKSDLVADQKVEIEARRDDACEKLRASREGRYHQLLDGQRELRDGLRARQETGLDNTLFFELIEDGRMRADGRGFRDVSSELTAPEAPERAQPPAATFTHRSERNGSNTKRGANTGGDLGIGLGLGVLFFFGALADGFLGTKPDPAPKRGEEQAPDPFDDVIAEARQRQQAEQEEADREWRKRQRSDGE
jgi:hypothetical protein